MPTVTDIAREVNVSVTTVSNVIHGKSSRVAKEIYGQIRRFLES